MCLDDLTATRLKLFEHPTYSTAHAPRNFVLFLDKTMKIKESQVSNDGDLLTAWDNKCAKNLNEMWQKCLKKMILEDVLLVIEITLKKIYNKTVLQNFPNIFCKSRYNIFNE